MGARDHGGGLDAARTRWGGDDWIDLSTGINPAPYPLPDIPAGAWTALPDTGAQRALTDAARAFWQVPDDLGILAAPGLSSIIAALPLTFQTRQRIHIPTPTYNEHAAAWLGAGHLPDETAPDLRVLVHPNNPDGRLWTTGDFAPLTVVDESFCDPTPQASLLHTTDRPGVLILKSFGKFWGLAGLRLGFVIGDVDTLARLRDALGPWPVSGPALAIGAAALRDETWADATRARLVRDAARLDGLMSGHGTLVGGTDLFRLYDVGDAAAMQDRLARAGIWTRIFPYSDRWIRLGLPPAQSWGRLKEALA